MSPRRCWGRTRPLRGLSPDSPILRGGGGVEEHFEHGVGACVNQPRRTDLDMYRYTNSRFIWALLFFSFDKVIFVFNWSPLNKPVSSAHFDTRVSVQLNVLAALRWALYGECCISFGEENGVGVITSPGNVRDVRPRVVYNPLQLSAERLALTPRLVWTLVGTFVSRVVLTHSLHHNDPLTSVSLINPTQQVVMSLTKKGLSTHLS